MSSSWSTVEECTACGEVVGRQFRNGDFVGRSGSCSKCGKPMAKITLISPPQ